MKTTLNRRILAKLALAPVALALLLLGGCLEKTLLWSPDGTRAAVIGSEGLYLCDADGKISTLLVPHVYRLAWLGDSQQLVLARSSETDEWAEVARVLGPERAGVVIARAESLWRQPELGGLLDLQSMHPGGIELTVLATFYLRERYGDALRAKVRPGEWDEIKTLKGEIHEVVIGRIDGGKITTGTQLHQGLHKIRELRVAPGDRAVAIVTEMTLNEEGKSRDDELQLLLARVNSPGATPVAVRVNAFPDWTADGRSVAYVQVAGGDANDDLRLGTLVQREVLDAGGAIVIKDEKKELAGWIFSANSRVRCLRDGRILFNAAEISLPIAAEDYSEQHEQLFAFDQARQATLVRLIPRKREADLPQTLAFFEVSPDEKQILFGNIDGAVAVMTMTTGEVAKVQEAGSQQNLNGQPVWRKDGEFSYTRRTERKTGVVPTRKAEVMLRSGGKEKVLSADWPDEMVNCLVTDRN